MPSSHYMILALSLCLVDRQKCPACVFAMKRNLDRLTRIPHGKDLVMCDPLLLISHVVRKPQPLQDSRLQGTKFGSVNSIAF